MEINTGPEHEQPTKTKSIGPTWSSRVLAVTLLQHVEIMHSREKCGGSHISKNLFLLASHFSQSSSQKGSPQEKEFREGKSAEAFWKHLPWQKPEVAKKIKMKDSEFAVKMGPIVAASQNLDNYELPDIIDGITSTKSINLNCIIYFNLGLRTQGGEVVFEYPTADEHTLTDIRVLDNERYRKALSNRVHTICLLSQIDVARFVSSQALTKFSQQYWNLSIHASISWFSIRTNNSFIGETSWVRKRYIPNNSAKLGCNAFRFNRLPQFRFRYLPSNAKPFGRWPSSNKVSLH